MTIQNHIKHLKIFNNQISSKITYLIKDYQNKYGPGGYTDERGKEIANVLQEIKRQLERV